MDATRVVAVHCSGGSAESGSGYVVAPRLVLTCAGAVPDPGDRVQVKVAADPVTYAGEVVWRGTPGGQDDAALVEVDDPAWWPVEGRVRWGQVVTNRPGIAGQVWGFQAGPVPGPGPVSGTLQAGAPRAGDRYVMRVDSLPPTPPGKGSSPGGELSGGALFCGDLLTGVVSVGPAAGQAAQVGAQVAATPVYLLCRDPGFRTVMARGGVGELALEPVELQQAIEVEPDPVGSPVSLLRARRQVVPFRGRARLLDDLARWAGGSGFAVWLLHGPCGQGKTRLAQEFANRLAGGGRWAYLWLGHDAAPEDLRILGDVEAPLLVIVDDAETRTEQVGAAARAAAGRTPHAGKAPLRMLLLARTGVDWWDSLRAGDPDTAELLEGAAARRLEEPEPELGWHTEAYRRAVSGFAAALPGAPDQAHRDWPGIAARLGAGPAWCGSESVLTVHMTALADLLDAAAREDGTHDDEDGDEPAPAGPSLVEDRLLVHEREYWRAGAATFGLAPPVMSESSLHDALTAALLLGAPGPDRADALLQRVPGLRDQAGDRLGAVRRWIGCLYPPGDTRPGGTRPWGSLQPDRLAERFIGCRLADDPGLAEHLVTGADPGQVTQLLTRYARAADHPAADSRLSQALTALCVHHPDTLAVAAIKVAATHVEDPGPLISALRHLTGQPETPLALVRSLAGQLPTSSDRLAGWAVELTQRLADAHRRLADGDVAFRPALAASLHDLSARLAALGRREDALAAIAKAVDIRRELAAAHPAHPAGYRPAVAASLHDLSARLAALGRRGDALAAITRAVDIRRELAAHDPAGYLPDLAASLQDRSGRLADLRQWEEARDAITEAVDLHRQLAAYHSAGYLPALAASLHDLSNRLVYLGRPGDALAAITGAVTIRRGLAGSRPDAFRPTLAASLHDLSGRLAAQGRPGDALTAINEALAIRRELVGSRADAFRPALAASLHNLSGRLAAQGRPEDALTAINEAVDLHRQLAEAATDASRSDLAASLNTRSGRLADLDRPEDALAEITEAVDIHRELAVRCPEVFRPALATSLHNLSGRLADLDRPEDALTEITEAVEIRRELAAAHPSAFRPDLAASLHSLSGRLADLHQPEDALTEINVAVTIRRGLAQAHPAAFRPALATSLHDQSRRLAAQERPEEALAAITEAVEIRRKLAAAHPDTFRPALAASLHSRSNRLADLDRPEEALAEITEAVHAFRHLTTVHPAAFRPALAASLHDQSDRLVALGRPEDALTAITEAVEIRQELAQAHPDTFRPALAASLHSRSNRLADLDRPEDALTEISRAVHAYRHLTTVHPAAFWPALAASLHDQSARLAALGRRKNALAAITEAVEIRRGLAEAHPDAFRPALAASLDSRSNRLADLDRAGEALTEINEAVGIRQELAQAHPAAFRPALATSLHDQSRRLAAQGRRKDALTAITEAVDIRRELAEAHPDTFRPDLARSLHDRARRLADRGGRRRNQAVAAANEAVVILRALDVQHPDVFQDDLQASRDLLHELVRGT